VAVHAQQTTSSNAQLLMQLPCALPLLLPLLRSAVCLMNRHTRNSSLLLQGYVCGCCLFCAALTACRGWSSDRDEAEDLEGLELHRHLVH
jgi:hypothetical protein